MPQEFHPTARRLGAAHGAHTIEVGIINGLKGWQIIERSKDRTRETRRIQRVHQLESQLDIAVTYHHIGFRTLNHACRNGVVIGKRVRIIVRVDDWTSICLRQGTVDAHLFDRCRKLIAVHESNSRRSSAGNSSGQEDLLRTAYPDSDLETT